MQVLIFVSHLNPCDVSAKPSSPQIASQFHPDTISRLSSVIYMIFTSTHVLCQLHPEHKILLSLRSILHLASTQVLIFVSHLHQVSYYLQPALKMCGPPPCRSHLTPIQVEIWVSHPSTSCLTSTKAPILTSHLHLGRVSPHPMSRYLHLSSI